MLREKYSNTRSRPRQDCAYSPTGDGGSPSREPCDGHWHEPIHIAGRKRDEPRVSETARNIRGNDRVDGPRQRRVVGRTELASGEEQHIRAVGKRRDRVGIEQIDGNRPLRPLIRCRVARPPTNIATLRSRDGGRRRRRKARTIRRASDGPILPPAPENQHVAVQTPAARDVRLARRRQTILEIGLGRKMIQQPHQSLREFRSRYREHVSRRGRDTAVRHDTSG